MFKHTKIFQKFRLLLPLKHFQMTKLQAMSGFAIQFNKNSFGIAPASTLAAGALQPGQSLEVSLSLNTTGPVQRMEPLNNLQVAIKNNVDVFYYACPIPLQIIFCEDGQLDKRFFLTTWKDIPAANEVFCFSSLFLKVLMLPVAGPVHHHRYQGEQY